MNYSEHASKVAELEWQKTPTKADRAAYVRDLNDELVALETDTPPLQRANSGIFRNAASVAKESWPCLKARVLFRLEASKLRSWTGRE